MNKSVIRFMEKSYYLIQIFFAFILNIYRFKTKKITLFEYRLRNKFLTYVTQFGTTDFYQNYPPLHISGKRSTLCRFNTYNFAEILDSDMHVLDIGGNIGFFSAYISRFVKQIDLVEKNKKLTNICRILLKYEKISNINIYNIDFKKLSTQTQYDLIFSLAIHDWIDLSFEKYLNKIYLLLKNQGLLLLESHFIYYNDNNSKLENKIIDLNLFKITSKGLIDDHDGQIREFYILKKI